MNWTDPEDAPPFWRAKAARLIGQHVLVGVTLLGADDGSIEQRQYHGSIEIADRAKGIGVRRADTGDLEWLPPDLRAFSPANPGHYTLRSSGETIIDPDLISTWTMKRAADSP